ncbi:Alpha/Beta hydrolase protein [Collybia nuda]|uniref:Alpha/Beta hydrolase protein n=1 Tax=Collybia nuda TaxID=64659 RepID=A0A9P5XV34_9AGAR|nr:Alpha/Beta hydrolase protein [Collybia nuda]KAF9457137.1 Alpha/Beta hydrolase protein [Collybia nuda]
MPHVHLTTPTGPIEMHYNISTPTAHSSPTIVPHLPCIIFLHAGYIAQEVFEPQFADPQLRRRFNLIGLDMRAFGSTKGLTGKDSYGPADSADDVYRFIRTLNLPPLHIFGLSIGTCIALEVATAHPEHVLSLTLCSPLPSKEPEDIIAGRMEVYRYWSCAFNHNANRTPQSLSEGDQALIDDIMHGAQQLCFNNQLTSLIRGMTKNAITQAMKNRAGSPTKLRESYMVSIAWFTNRRPFSRASLSKISCPVRLIHCSDDIAYPLRHARELKSQLRQAGVGDVVLCQVPGPHYGSVLNPQMCVIYPPLINPILRDVVLSVSPRQPPNLRNAPSQANGFHDCQRMTTPFTHKLAKYGYDPHDDESDSELE